MSTWEKWLSGTSVFELHWYLTPLQGGIVAYLINSWIFYHWHRARHEIRFLWLLCHQFHHSAQRIETATSFYKHPIEILLDSIMMTILLYPILGLPKSSIYLSIFSAFGEYIYHANIRTPRWLGYFFQRPESHRIHHLRNRRLTCKNYSDLPLWDILGGTFENPVRMDDPCGFEPHQEAMVKEMLLFKDVIQPLVPRHNARTVASLFLIFIGCLQPLGYIFNSDVVRGLAFATVASPSPLVFSVFKGVETFSTTFEMTTRWPNGTQQTQMMTPALYGKLEGPYNRRNVYGVIFSHGPFFDTEQMITLRQQVLKHGICNGGSLIREFGLGTEHLESFHVLVRSKTVGFEDRQWWIGVDLSLIHI